MNCSSRNEGWQMKNEIDAKNLFDAKDVVLEGFIEGSSDESEVKSDALEQGQSFIEKKENEREVSYNGNKEKKEEEIEDLDCIDLERFNRSSSVFINLNMGSRVRAKTYGNDKNEDSFSEKQKNIFILPFLKEDYATKKNDIRTIKRMNRDRSLIYRTPIKRWRKNSEDGETLNNILKIIEIKEKQIHLGAAEKLLSLEDKKRKVLEKLNKLKCEKEKTTKELLQSDVVKKKFGDIPNGFIIKRKYNSLWKP